jgi:hypothetical protein
MRRRDFLAAAAMGPAALRAAPPKRLAAITTTYHVRSHADNVITRLIEGYWIGDKHYDPPCRVVSLYMDQIHPADIGERLGQAYGFPVCRSIEEAVTLGTGRLAVDGVVIVAEHGNYPFNEKQQQLYPRFEFFERVAKVYRSSKRSVPLFTDKHLSYDWAKAKSMYDTSRELGFPLLAGSSLPVTFRRPDLDYPRGVEFAEALMVGGGWVSDGGVFHNLETLQVFVERRKGGETGIRAVQHLEGAEVWRAADQGVWSRELMRAALGRAENPGRMRPEDVKNPVLASLEYNDGFRASVLMLPGVVNEYLAAFRVKGRQNIDSTLCYIPIENSNNFSPLVHAAVEMFSTGRRLYPVERTLLTTGALSFIMESAYRGHRRLETPELKISYTAPEKSYYADGPGS